MKKSLFLWLVLILAAGNGYAQHDKSHAHMISLNFLQIKEEMNYGMVFRGPGLGYTYSATWQTEKRILAYEARYI